MSKNDSITTLQNLNSEPLVTRWKVFPEINPMHRRIEDVFNQVFNNNISMDNTNTYSAHSLELSPDLFETEEELIFILPLPGIEAADLNIEATGKNLTIQGERKSFYQNEKATQRLQSWWSRSTGKFNGSFYLPVEVNNQNITANYTKGVLELHLPKAEAAKPKTVRVSIQTE